MGITGHKEVDGKMCGTMEVSKEDSKELTDQNLRWEEGACQANEGRGWLSQCGRRCRCKGVEGRRVLMPLRTQAPGSGLVTDDASEAERFISQRACVKSEGVGLYPLTSGCLCNMYFLHDFLY